MGGTLIKVDIGHGRGWLAPEPAASLARIDAQLGRLADINEAGRSPEQADENRRRWLAYAAYLNGGPWAPKAPYALGSDESVHCWGYAADTDDSYDPAAAAVWDENGWVQTALYPNNPAKHEPWHREYRKDRDQHLNDPAPAGGATAPVKQHWKDADMRLIGTTDKKVWLVGPGATVHVLNPEHRALLARVLNSNPSDPDSFTPDELRIIDGYVSKLTDRQNMNGITFLHTTDKGVKRTYLAAPGAGSVYIESGNDLALLERYLASGSGAVDTFTPGQRSTIDRYLKQLGG